MKKNSKKITTFNLILIMTLILLTAVGVSYAWFSANLTGGESATSITLTGGSMSIAFSGGTAITASNIFPKPEPAATKTFTVAGTNTMTLTMTYKLTFEVLTNTFSASALKYRLASTNTGENGTLVPAKPTDQNIPTGKSSIVLGTGTFTGPTGGSKVHTYVLTVYFPDTGTAQNVDQGKSFTAYVKIENV